MISSHQVNMAAVWLPISIIAMIQVAFLETWLCTGFKATLERYLWPSKGSATPVNGSKSTPVLSFSFVLPLKTEKHSVNQINWLLKQLSGVNCLFHCTFTWTIWYQAHFFSLSITINQVAYCLHKIKLLYSTYSAWSYSTSLILPNT